ncbi:MAG: FtsW/RodA/SpoVE family cell cycle protein [Patescibacteria group bacterium]
MNFLRNFDLWIFIPAAFLVTLGGIILSSVSPQSFPQQFFYIFLALLTLLLFTNLDLRFFRGISPALYIISIALLVATLISGAIIRGSSRWIEIGPIVFQPSEIVKPLLILFFASIVSAKRGILLAMLTFLPAFILVFIQPDLGSTIILASGLFGVLLFGGIPMWWIGGGALLFGLLTPVLWNFLAEYQKQRIYTFLTPSQDPLGAGYNSIQAIIAIGSGGMFGRGLGQGTQSQLAFLPERQTDFVFAAISEELGFLASLAIIIAFITILTRLVWIIKSTNDSFLQALLGGIFFIFFVHSVVNIGMNLGILPVTGIPLPFVSSGGSALISMSAMLGLASQASRLVK